MPLFRARPGLLPAFRKGERDALDVVYRGYVEVIDRYLHAQASRAMGSHLAQASAIADLLQETFIRAFSPTGRHGYDGARDYGPYLLAIARNRLIDAQRACGRELLISPDDPLFAVGEASAIGDDWYEPRVLAALTDYLTALAPGLRDVYQQRFVRGGSQREASSALGVSRRAIRTAETQLRAGLRKALTCAGISLRELVRPGFEVTPDIRPTPQTLVSLPG